MEGLTYLKEELISFWWQFRVL